MDDVLAEAARKQYAENLFESVMKCRESNHSFAQKLLSIAVEYLTEEQKTALRRKGYTV